MLKKGDTVGIVCCSDGMDLRKKAGIEQTKECLEMLGLNVAESPFLYRRESLASGTGMERAGVINQMYKDTEIQAIFDVSGGNLANQVLEYLDYDLIGREEKEIWGYSDLTVLLNSVFSKTGSSSWLYQIRNLAGVEGEIQRVRFGKMLSNRDESALQPSDWRFLQGERMEGIVFGGNIRCLLKLAGTEYFPDPANKIIFLESYGGSRGVITSLLTQLRLMKVFEKTSGLLLGTFTEFDSQEGQEAVEKLVREVVGNDRLPIARSMMVGHGADSCGLHIGVNHTLERCDCELFSDRAPWDKL